MQRPSTDIPRGYDQGVFGGLLANPSFQQRFNNPDTTIQGQIVSTYTLGCIFGAIMSIFAGDVLGRRRSVILGCTFLTIGGLLQATAYTLPHVSPSQTVRCCIADWRYRVDDRRPHHRRLGHRGQHDNNPHVAERDQQTRLARQACRVRVDVPSVWLCGYELDELWFYLPPRKRGQLVCNFPFILAFIDIMLTRCRRFPLGFQSLLALGTAAFVPFVVESPRWLCLKDREMEAKVVISRLLAKPLDDEEVHESLQLMVEHIAHERAEGQVGWREVFQNGRRQTFRRILLGAGANFMQQMGGVNVVA